MQKNWKREKNTESLVLPTVLLVWQNCTTQQVHNFSSLSSLFLHFIHQPCVLINSLASLHDSVKQYLLWSQSASAVTNREKQGSQLLTAEQEALICKMHSHKRVPCRHPMLYYPTRVAVSMAGSCVNLNFLNNKNFIYSFIYFKYNKLLHKCGTRTFSIHFQLWLLREMPA